MRDLKAVFLGVNNAFLLIPEILAFGVLTGMPILTGLRTCLIFTFLKTIFGT